jgi:hypothetical protein
MELNLYSEFYFQVSGHHKHNQEWSQLGSVIRLNGYLVFGDENRLCRVSLNLLTIEDLLGFWVWLNAVESAIDSGGTGTLFEFVEPITFEFMREGIECIIYLEFRTLYEDKDEHRFAFMSIHSEAYRKMKRMLLRDLGYFTYSVN